MEAPVELRCKLRRFFLNAAEVLVKVDGTRQHLLFLGFTE